VAADANPGASAGALGRSATASELAPSRQPRQANGVTPVTPRTLKPGQEGF
jgi:hypothetical protein